MPINKTEAIVLRRINLADSDRIIVMLSREMGKFKCIAKGARKINYKYASAFELLTHLTTICYYREGRNLSYIKSVEPINSFHRVREEPLKFYVCSYIAEVVDSMLKEGDPNPELFDFLIRFIILLSRSSNLMTLLRTFEIKLLSLTGFMPILNMCSVCKCEINENDLRYSFSLLINGVLCFRCRHRDLNAMKINIGTLRFLKKILELEIEKTDRVFITKSMEHMLEYITHKSIILKVEKEFKTYTMLIQIIQNVINGFSSLTSPIS